MTVWAIVFTVALCLEVLFLNLTDITEQARSFFYTFKTLYTVHDVSLIIIVIKMRVLLRGQLLYLKQCIKRVQNIRIVSVTSRQKSKNI